MIEARSTGEITPKNPASTPFPDTVVPGKPDVWPRYDLRIFQALRRIMRTTDLHSRQLEVRYKVTGPQLVCLVEVAEAGALTPTAIARRVFLSPSTVVGILDRLAEKGMIERTRDVKDRRLVYVSATPKGKALAEVAPPPFEGRLAEALTELPELEQSTIALSLERLVTMMEEKQALPLKNNGEVAHESED